MQELDKSSLKIDVIQNGLEKYMSFSISGKLSFIDSFQFLSYSLDSLVKNLNNIYPYEYISHFEKFKEQLPNKERFYSLLTGTKISDKKYEHALKIWNKFEMKTMKYYHYLYLKCDNLLSVSVFEKFRNNSIENYGLYPSHYMSVPTLKWDTMVNMT